MPPRGATGGERLRIAPVGLAHARREDRSLALDCGGWALCSLPPGAKAPRQLCWLAVHRDPCEAARPRAMGLFP